MTRHGSAEGSHHGNRDEERATVGEVARHEREAHDEPDRGNRSENEPRPEPNVGDDEKGNEEPGHTADDRRRGADALPR